MITENEMKILQYLNTYNGDAEIKELAEFIDVGERSIRNYIKNINLTFKDLELNVKKGKVTSHNRIILSNLISNSDSYYMTANSKKKLLLFHILFDEYINLSSLANELEISRTSIKTYFDEVKEKYRTFGYEFVSANRNGLKAVVNEDNLRIAQIQFLLEYTSFNSYDQKIIKSLIDEYLVSVNFETISRFLVNLKNRNNFNITEQQYKMIYYLLAVQIKRIKINKSLSNQIINEASFMPDVGYFKKMMFTNSLPFNEDEYNYFTNKLNEILYITSDNESNTSFEFSLLVLKIINLFSKYSGTNLINDRILYDSLIMHMKPTMFRLQNNINPVDVDVNGIISKHEYEYNLTKKVFNELNFFTNEKYDSKELAILTIYFKSALSRLDSTQTGTRNILIVCNYGYGTSLLLKDQISDLYMVDIIANIAHYELNHLNLKNVDVIITTNPNLSIEKNIEMVAVSPVLSNEDILKLNKVLTKKSRAIDINKVISEISKSCTINDIDKLKNDMLNLIPNIKDNTNNDFRFLFSKNNILIHQDIKTWQEAVRKGGELLYSNNSCTSEYIDNLVESFENYGEYMIIKDQICIPHSKTDKEVIKSDMSIVHLNKPVVYNDKQLRTFICFCSNNNDEHLNSLILISDLSNEFPINELFDNMYSSEEIYQWLLEESNNRIE